MKTLEHLIQAHRFLGLAQSPSQTQVWEEIRSLLSNHIEKPAKTLLSLPAHYIELLMQDSSQKVQVFIKNALCDMSNVSRLADPVFQIKSETLSTFKKAGLEYDRHVTSDLALRLWLEKDPVFGKDAWRKKFPRKNPAVAYWEKEGLSLPKKGLSPEGLDIFVDAIKNFPVLVTQKMHDKVRPHTHFDWRLLVALHIQGYGEYVQSVYSPWNKVSGLRNVNVWRNFFKEKTTGHAALAHTKLLQNGPDIKSLLTRDALDIPQNPIELFQTS